MHTSGVNLSVKSRERCIALVTMAILVCVHALGFVCIPLMVGVVKPGVSFMVGG